MDTRPELTPNPINERSFDRLKELQITIKKESALKELCKKKTIIYNL